jgi:hypothetical protein
MPNSEVAYHIVSCLYFLKVRYSFCAVFRFYNGDVFSDLEESLHNLEKMCPCLI